MIHELILLRQHLHLDTARPRNNNGLLAKTMRIERRENRRMQARMNNGTACGKRVGSRTRWRGDDQAIGMKRCERLVVDGRSQIHQTCNGPLRDHCFIQHISLKRRGGIAHDLHVKEGAFFQDTFAMEELAYERVRFFQARLRQKADRAAVDAENGNAEIAKFPHGAENGAVPANDHEKIQRRLIQRRAAADARKTTHAFRVDEDFRAFLSENLHNTINGLILCTESGLHRYTDAGIGKHGESIEMNAGLATYPREKTIHRYRPCKLPRPTESALAELCPERIIRKNPRQSVADGKRIFRIHEKRRITGNLTQGTARARKNRNTDVERIDDRHAQTLVERREDESMA